ncbi:MAG: hypothetical protein JXR50_11770 [Prolixibacteraceae bacterium]|nr:hypothetical protein [Prolixibacteraceae bacterium]MBN2650408.1 hypothetical protein [Prolixibacteraceae bacterium]
MDKFLNKYRIQSTRLQNWDYGWNADYFVTICTQSRQYFFGNIVNGRMILSEIGKIANKYWINIPEHFPFAKLDVHVVMPNHIHGIITIDKPNDGRNGTKNEKRTTTQNRNVGGIVETQYFASLPQSPQSQNLKNKFGPQSQNLASIIRGYKTGVTIYARINNINFGWQSRYHDHIIRNKTEYQRIRNYIINNPKNWDNDKFYH